MVNTNTKEITGSFTKKKKEQFTIKKDGSITNQNGISINDDVINIVTNNTSPTDNVDKIPSEQNNCLTTHHIETLIIGCRLAQEKGVYSLEEARTIMNAIEFLNTDK